jgi:hypothetical protein
MNQGYRAYVAVRRDGVDYLMGFDGGATVIYFERPAPVEELAA